MIVHGGLDDHNRVLDDVAIFSFLTMKWTDIGSQGAKPGAVAYHCATTISQKPIPNDFDLLNLNQFR